MTRSVPALILFAAAGQFACSAGGDSAPGSRGGSAGSTGGTGGAAGHDGAVAGSGGQGTGGAAATGGTAGSGGSGGSAGAAGGEGGGPPSGPCTAPGLTFCSDFEAGAVPNELVFFPAYLRDQMANLATLDATLAHSGAQSVKFPANQSFSRMLGVATPGATFWGRVYIRSDGPMAQAHNTFLAATDGDGDPNNGEHVRIGEFYCQLMVNRRSDDAALLSNPGNTYDCNLGLKLGPDRWYCLEFFYDGSNSELRVFVDSEEIAPLHATTWGPYAYGLFKFGMEEYMGSTNKNLWYDDVAIGTQRIGCF